jgi:hypothetical protein
MAFSSVLIGHMTNDLHSLCPHELSEFKIMISVFPSWGYKRRPLMWDVFGPGLKTQLWVKITIFMTNGCQMLKMTNRCCSCPKFVPGPSWWFALIPLRNIHVISYEDLSKSKWPSVTRDFWDEHPSTTSFWGAKIQPQHIPI